MLDDDAKTNDRSERATIGVRRTGKRRKSCRQSAHGGAHHYFGERAGVGDAGDEEEEGGERREKQPNSPSLSLPPSLPPSFSAMASKWSGAVAVQWRRRRIRRRW